MIQKKLTHTQIVTMFEDNNDISLYRVSIGSDIYEIAEVDAWSAERAAHARYRREHGLANGAQTPEASATMIAAIAPKSPGTVPGPTPIRPVSGLEQTRAPIPPRKTNHVLFVFTYFDAEGSFMWIARMNSTHAHRLAGPSAQRLYWVFKYSEEWTCSPAEDGGYFAWPKKATK